MTQASATADVIAPPFKGVPRAILVANRVRRPRTSTHLEPGHAHQQLRLSPERPRHPYGPPPARPGTGPRRALRSVRITSTSPASGADIEAIEAPAEDQESPPWIEGRPTQRRPPGPRSPRPSRAATTKPASPTTGTSTFARSLKCPGRPGRNGPSMSPTLSTHGRGSARHRALGAPTARRSRNVKVAGPVFVVPLEVPADGGPEPCWNARVDRRINPGGPNPLAPWPRDEEDEPAQH